MDRPIGPETVLKIADFGLTRNPTNEWMTAVVGTFVLKFITEALDGAGGI